MSERPKEHRKESAQRRRAAALRDNLKRRKAQARGRQDQRLTGEASNKPHDSAGIGAEK
jgi:hypothetical protein